MNFRLTEQEYDQLMAACAMQGSRCVSEFARTAVLTLTQSGTAPDTSVQTRLLSLDQKLSIVGSRLYRLVQLLEATERPEREDDAEMPPRMELERNFHA